MEISFPLDDGFLRRECPNCMREFKWHHGPTDDRPDDAVDPEEYFCPYCGQRADHDSWWTQEQRAFIEQSAAAMLSTELGKAFDRISRASSRSGIRIQYKSGSPGHPPLPLDEVDDMATVVSPCHSYEPIKVLEHWNEPFHCIVCGQRFVA